MNFSNGSIDDMNFSNGSIDDMNFSIGSIDDMNFSNGSIDDMNFFNCIYNMVQQKACFHSKMVPQSVRFCDIYSITHIPFA